VSALRTYVDTLPPQQQGLVRELDAIIRAAAPDLTASLKWGNLTYHARRNVCAIVSHPRHVNLQLWRGAEIDDPRDLLDGTGKQMRHVKLIPGEAFDAAYLTTLVRAAAELNAP
jgi:hypothetical protein